MRNNSSKKTAHLPAAARELIESFAVALAEVFEVDARQRLIATLGLGVEAAAKNGSARVMPHRLSAHATRTPKPAKGMKRDPAELERLGDRLLAYVKGHPGERIEQIATAIGAQTTELKLPMSKLLEAKSVKKKGMRRSTKYFSALAA